MDVRVGIIGTGWVAFSHIEALKKIPEVVIAAIAGRNTTKAKELTEGLNGPVQIYQDYHLMLQQEKLDAVFILLPPHIHGDVEKICAQYVPAVFIEKPICNQLGQALEIEKAFDKAGTIVSVGYMNRYRKSVQRVRQIFESSEHKPVLINGWWTGGMPGPLWWRNKSQSGGQFVEQCTHVVDAARYVAGDIVEVFAYSATGFVKDVPDYSVEDAMVVNVRFASGAIGHFSTSCFALPGFENHEGVGLTIESREAYCKLTGWGLKLEVDHRYGHLEQMIEEKDIFVTQNKAFIQAVIEKNPSHIKSSYKDAIETLKVTLAADDSIKTGKTVRLSPQ